MGGIAGLRSFVQDITKLVGTSANAEAAIRQYGGEMLSKLVSADDWLPVAQLDRTGRR